MSEDVQEEVQVEEQKQTEPSATDKEARAQGWVPLEEFRGEESDWIDSETFVKRGKEINPILRKNNERIQRELDMTKRQMEDLRKATDEFKKFQKESYDRKVHEIEVELQDLKTLKRQAVTSGDGDLVVEIDDKMEEARARQEAAKAEKIAGPVHVPQQDPQITQEIEEWVEQNSWYKTDPKMAAATNAIAEQIRRVAPFATGKKFLDLVDKDLKEMFPPEKLGRKVAPRNPVGSGKPSNSGRGNSKSYDNLPSDAKAACDKFVKQKLMSKEDYVNSYDWS